MTTKALKVNDNNDSELFPCIANGQDRSRFEQFKADSNYLEKPLVTELTNDLKYFSTDGVQLLKFHGSYQQDNRENRQKGAEKDWQMMLRLRSPGGFVPGSLFIALDKISDQLGNKTLRATTRQAFQMHGIRKENLKEVIKTIVNSMGSTLAACGDINRNVMAPAAPYQNGGYPAARKLANEIADLLSPISAEKTYLELWAESFKAPVKENIEVIKISGKTGSFRVDTNIGSVEASIVIVATATYQEPKIPEFAKLISKDILSLHADTYKSPNEISDGAVLVVGSGQTGCQIVEDLIRANRKVYFSVSNNGRLPRRYRGKDCIEWQNEMKLLDRTPDMLDDPKDRFKGDPHVSGRDGGKTLSLHEFREKGVELLGKIKNVEEYLTPPDKLPEPQPDPMQELQMQKAQKQIELQERQAQLAEMKAQMDGQFQQMKLEQLNSIQQFMISQ